MASRQQRLCHVVLVVMATLILTDAKSIKQNPAASDIFTLCSRQDPNTLNKCVLNNINALRPRLVAGMYEIKLIPLDPINIPRMELKEGEGNFRFHQTLKNLTVHGLRNYEVKSVEHKLDSKELSVTITMATPALHLTGDYVIDGQIMIIPIRGEGDCTLDFKDVTTVTRIHGNVVSHHGEEYADIKDVTWDIQVGGAKSHFNNLFNGDKLLGDATNNFLNQNWKQSFETYKHLPEEAFGRVFKDLTKKVYSRFPLKELFKD